MTAVETFPFGSWDQSDAIFWTQKLVGLALLQQTLEYWRLRPNFAAAGVWTWKDVSQDWPPRIRNLLAVVLDDGAFPYLLILQLSSTVGIVAGSNLSVVVGFVTTLLIAARFRGTFNGGSDYMTALLLAALALAVVVPAWTGASLAYIAVQSLLSYTVAGWSKIRHKTWRNGEQLRVILTASNYPVPERVVSLIQKQTALNLTVLSAVILIFECTFPLALWGPRICLGLLAGALVMQLGFAFAFGLNRFWLAWLASFPAVYYASIHFSF